MPRHSTPILVGQRFGRWLGVALDATRSRSSFVVRCDCGEVKTVVGYSLRSGDSTSCGCLSVERFSRMNRTHGGSRRLFGAAVDRIYGVWNGVKRRCYNANDKSYPRYGGCGITVCERWRTSFVAFRDDMGSRPSAQHSIDRIENDLGYWCGKPECPECGPAGRSPNCRWATRSEQGRNKRNNVWLTAYGETRLLVEWARRLETTPTRISKRVFDLGWSVEDAVTKPVTTRGSKRANRT